MPTGRCAHCGFLCNPQLFGCLEDLPCSRQRICYCSQFCQSENANRHRNRYHRRHPTVEREQKICHHFLRGACLYGDKCKKVHPDKARQNSYKSDEELGHSISSTPDPNSPHATVENNKPELDCDGGDEEASISSTALILRGHELDIRPVTSLELEQQPVANSVTEQMSETDELKLEDGISERIPESGEVQEMQAPGGDSRKTSESFESEDFGSFSESFSSKAKISTVTKKSRLEMRKEARKLKKAARKQMKMQALASVEKGTNSLNETPEPQEIAPTPTEENPETKDVFQVVDDSTPENEESKTNQSVPSGSLHDDDSSRKLTKREKKKEERRLLNALKKKEKLEARQRQEIAEFKSKVAETDSLMKKDKFLEAAVELSRLLLRCQNGKSALFAKRSRCYLALGKLKNALKDSEEALKEDKSQENLQNTLRLQLRLGKVNAAHETSSLMKHVDPEDEKMLSHIEEEFASLFDDFEKENWSKTHGNFSKLEALCPQSEKFLLMKAEAKLHLHIYDEADNILKKLKHELPGDAHYKYVLGVQSYYKDSWWECEEQENIVKIGLENAQEKVPWAGKLLSRFKIMSQNYKKLRRQIKQNDAKAAKTIISNSYSIDPNNLYFLADLHYLMGTLQEQDEERIRELTLSLKLRGSQKAFQSRGHLYRSRRRYAEALKDFESAYELPGENKADLEKSIEQMKKQLKNVERQRPKKIQNDLYAILGVDHNASTEDIKNAFTKKSDELRSKRVLSSHDARLEIDVKLRRLNKAHRILKDKQQRDIYDRQRKRSASSDVDVDFSDEDYEWYDSHSDDDEQNKGAQSKNTDVFTNLYDTFIKTLDEALTSDTTASSSTNWKKQEPNLRMQTVGEKNSRQKSQS